MKSHCRVNFLTEKVCYSDTVVQYQEGFLMYRVINDSIPFQMSILCGDMRTQQMLVSGCVDGCLREALLDSIRPAITVLINPSVFRICVQTE